MSTEIAGQVTNLNVSPTPVENAQLVPHGTREAENEQRTATEVFEAMQTLEAHTLAEGVRNASTAIFPERVVAGERYSLGRFITTDNDGEVAHTLYTITSTSDHRTHFGVQRSNGEDMFLTAADLGADALGETNDKTSEEAIAAGVRLLTDYSNAPDAPIDTSPVLKTDTALAVRRRTMGRALYVGAVIVGGAVGALGGQLVSDAQASSRAEHVAVAQHRLEKAEQDVTAAVQRGASQRHIDELKLDVRNAKSEVWSAGDTLRYPLGGMAVVGLLSALATLPASRRMERTDTIKKKA